MKNLSPQLISDYPTSITRSGNACNLLLYYTYYCSFFIYIINVIEFASGLHLQRYNIKSGLSTPPCFFHTSIQIYSVFIISAGLIRAALFTCQNNVPAEIATTTNKAITKIEMLTGVLTTKSDVYMYIRQYDNGIVSNVAPPIIHIYLRNRME